MKTFAQLKPGDPFYEHIGSQIIHHTVIKITEEKKIAYNSVEIEYAKYGNKKKTLVLGDETTFFPFYTSIEEVEQETEILVYSLRKEGVS